MYDGQGTDEAELSGGMGGMRGIGDVDPEVVPPWLRGGAGGWPGQDNPTPFGSEPTKVAGYMQHLRTLGYDAPENGNARDPDVMTAVAQFQADHQPEAGVIDGLVGPLFYAAVDAALAGRRASPGGGGVAPGGEPPSPRVVPVVDRPSGSSVGLWIGLGVLGIAAIGGAWYAWGR